MDYLIIVASVNENMKLAIKIQNKLKDMNKSSSILDVVKEDIEMYTSVNEQINGIPKKINNIVESMKKVKGYIIISPEYNYSIAPTLTNLIAWVSRVGDDFRELFNEKIILLGTFSGGGGTDALNAKRTQFTSLGSLVIPREILVNYKKPLNEDSLEKTLKQFILIEEKLNN